MTSPATLRLGGSVATMILLAICPPPAEAQESPSLQDTANDARRIATRDAITP